MRARVIKIGTSQGLRIPKPILEQTGIMDEVEIEVEYQFRHLLNRALIFRHKTMPIMKKYIPFGLRP